MSAKKNISADGVHKDPFALLADIIDLAVLEHAVDAIVSVLPGEIDLILVGLGFQVSDRC